MWNFGWCKPRLSMSSVSVKLTWDKQAIGTIENKTMRGLVGMGFDIAARARQNAPYLTGALRNSIRVQEVNDNVVEVIAGGGRVPYAWRREHENKLHPDRTHYMQRAQESIMVGNYMQKYFGDITK